MAKKKIKKAKKVEKITEPKPQELPAQVITNEDVLIRMDLFDKSIDVLNQRIDRIVTAISTSKSVKGL